MTSFLNLWLNSASTFGRYKLTVELDLSMTRSCRSILCMVTLTSLCMVPLTAASPISEIISNYQAAQDQLQSLMAIGETTGLTGVIGVRENSHKFKSKFFMDKDRVDLHLQKWNSLSSLDADISPDDAQHQSFIWDGKLSIEHRARGTGAIEDDKVLLYDDHSQKGTFLGAMYYGNPLLGVMWGDNLRVDEILLQAETISTHEEYREGENSSYIVVEAETAHGDYKIWFDPENSYHIAKAEIKKEIGDLAWDEPIQGSNRLFGKRAGYSFSLEDVRFQEIDGIVVPVEAKYQEQSYYADGRITYFKIHHKRTHVELNPDFVAAGAFQPNIPDGTPVRVMWKRGPISYKWENGWYVPDVEPELIRELDKSIESITPIEPLQNAERRPIDENAAITSGDNDTSGAILAQETHSDKGSNRNWVIGFIAIAFLGVLMFWMAGRGHRAKS